MSDTFDIHTLLSTEINESHTEMLVRQEKYVRDIWESLGISLEDFLKLYVMESYPLEVKTEDAEDNKLKISFTQNIRIRLKTKEELEQ